MKRDDFTEGMPGDGARLNAKALQNAQHREARRADGWLRPLRRGQKLLVFLGLKRIEARLREGHARKRRVELREVLGRIPRRKRIVEAKEHALAHADVLAALPREEEGDIAERSAVAVDRSIRRAKRFAGLHLFGRLEQLRAEVVGIARDQRDAVRILGVRILRRADDEVFECAVFGEVGCGSFKSLCKLAGARSGERKELRIEDAATMRARITEVLLERNVEVRTAETERAHRRTTRVVLAANPGTRFGREVERTIFDIELRVRRVDLDGRGEHLVMKRKHGLHETRGSRGSLRMPDLRFHRAERAPLIVISGCFTKDHSEAFEFRSVSRDRSRAVSFDKLDRLRAITRLRVRAPKRLCLAAGDRRVHGRARAIAARTDAANHGIDSVAVPLGIFKTLQRHHAKAFAEHGSVRLIAERAAVSALRERGRLRKTEIHKDIVHRVGAAADDDVGLTNAKFADSHRERAERAGASRVRDAVRAAEVEPIRNTSRDDISEHAGEGRFLPRRVMRFDALAGFLDFVFAEPHFAERLCPHGALQAADHRAEQLLRARDAEDHAHPLTIGIIELSPGGVFKHALRDDECEQLTGVRGGNRRRGNAPRHGIEIDVADKRATLCVGLVRRLWVRIVVILDQPVRGGHVRDEVLLGEDIAPEPGGFHGAGKESAEANDGDGGVVRFHVDEGCLGRDEKF